MATSIISRTVSSTSAEFFNRPGKGHNTRGGSMYAIVFDLDTQTLKDTYGGNSSNNAYGEISAKLKDYGFEWMQGSTYFGDDSVDAVTCVIAVQDLGRTYSWFQPSVRDIRMLRIEENNDLMPALKPTTRKP